MQLTSNYPNNEAVRARKLWMAEMNVIGMEQETMPMRRDKMVRLSKKKHKFPLKQFKI